MTSDRFAAYAHLPSDRREVCWAPLRRDFRAMSDRADAGSGIGEGLLMDSAIRFDGWSKIRAGVASRRTFATRTVPWLRREVCWRKTSFGTDSAGGSRLVERLLTTIESCRRQGRDLLAFLHQAVEAHRSGGQPPSLLPAGA